MNSCVMVTTTHQTNSIGRWVGVDVLRQVSSGNPLRDQLQRIEVYPQEGDNIFVHQTFPYYGLLEESLSFRQMGEY